MQDMINNSKWLNGPMSYRQNEECWLSDLTNVQNQLSDDDAELKPDVQSRSQTLSHRPNEDFLSSLIQRHSSWEKLKKTIAWLLRFKSWFIVRYSQRSINPSVKMLSVGKLQRAEREIVKHVQRIAFPMARRALQKISSLKYSRQVTTELKN